MPRPGSMRVKYDDGYFGGPINPTEGKGLAQAAGDEPVLTDALPPPDHVWIPQLYQKHGLRETARISLLPIEKVKQLLASQGIPLRQMGRPTKAEIADRSPL